MAKRAKKPKSVLKLPDCQGRSKSRPVRRSKREPLERSGVLLGLRGRGPLERSGRGLRPREARLVGCRVTSWGSVCGGFV
jgi:hypothetical protein